MVDGVELLLVHQPQQVRELERRHAARLEQQRQPGDEVVERRHVGEHVVAHQQVGADALGDELASELRCRRSAPRVGMPSASAACATLPAGSMPSTGMPRSTN